MPAKFAPRLLLAGLLAVALPTIHAQTVSYVKSIGSAGSGNEQFSVPGFITMDATSVLYISDNGNSRIQTYLASGGGLFFGHIDGLNSPYGLAVNNTSGDVYVAEPYDIKRFSAAGVLQATYTPAIDTHNDSGLGGVAINQTTGDFYVVDTQGTAGNYILEYTATGTFVRGFGTTGGAPGQFYQGFGIAINQTTGQVYVTESGSSSDGSDTTVRVMRYSATGTYETEWGSHGAEPANFDLPYGIAVDDDGHVYVANLLGNRVNIFDGDGAYITQFGLSSGAAALHAPRGVVVSSDGFIYVTSTNDNAVKEYQVDFTATPPVVTPPTVVDQPPTVAPKAKKKKIVATKSVYKLKGTAADPDGNLARVEVQIGKKPFKAARGTSAWVFKIHLKPGTTKISIRSVDTNGSTSAIVKKKIKYTPAPTA